MHVFENQNLRPCQFYCRVTYCHARTPQQFPIDAPIGFHVAGLVQKVDIRRSILMTEFHILTRNFTIK